jgi:hypothetical protein
MSNIYNPDNKKLGDFKALCFDVYGTLIVSAACTLKERVKFKDMVGLGVGNCRCVAAVVVSVAWSIEMDEAGNARSVRRYAPLLLYTTMIHLDHPA